MKLYLSMLGALLLTSNVAFADVPTQSYIKNTILNYSTLSGYTASNASSVEISKTSPIYLLNGEIAYISNIYFKDGARNFSSSYVLTRPKLKQSAIIFEASEHSEYKVDNIVYDNKKVSVIKFNASSSGQGSQGQNNRLVYFNGWNAKVIDRELAEIDDGFCYTNSEKQVITVNTANKTYVKKSYVSTKPCSEKYKVTNTITKPINFIKNEKEANQPFSIKMVK